jgi:hypothetical protein
MYAREEGLMDVLQEADMGARDAALQVCRDRTERGAQAGASQ